MNSQKRLLLDNIVAVGVVSGLRDVGSKVVESIKPGIG